VAGGLFFLCGSFLFSFLLFLLHARMACGVGQRLSKGVKNPRAEIRNPKEIRRGKSGFNRRLRRLTQIFEQEEAEAAEKSSKFRAWALI
jgi:hypothetical protein